MRAVRKMFEKIKKVTYYEEAITEEIYLIEENKLNNTVVVRTVFKGIYGEVLSEMTYWITGDNYDKLMADSPEFAPGKPENEYREVDLWYIIDKITEGV